ncbi:DNA-3-methyladenine glycosylase [Fictibacillus sp. WQ 8-8]|uniref:DNA-3-methyladenine glycosylase n=1 Tax=unclassified Fictibacillus TaxID=2644029 RepID=UPI0007821BB0|nr:MULTISPECIES: DNA-3-methyladenine glycosylase [unclassified Fictibacillus]MCQ6266674.1 DNA-3-methyladenine glycosylase [Fictibacillus sp. WQ 8-8]UZJ80204.1 DNA-3-methyladenine glycosylase [Fictibacillus sp. KU28468]
MNEKLFELPTLKLAKTLLGMELVHQTDEGLASGIIAETEAYMGPEDMAAHSFGGKRTPRTEIMYAEPGHVYVYFIYGMHTCFNIVSGPLHKPEAILIRALEPKEGIPLMMHRRSMKIPVLENGAWKPGQLKKLTNGPGKLCKAMGISLNDYGLKLNAEHLYLKEYKTLSEEDIVSGPRINVDYAGEAVHYPYRFWIKDNIYVSK